MTYLAIEQVIQDAKDSFDLWYAFIIGLPALVAAIAAIRNRADINKHYQEQTKVNTSVLDQVRNSHEENLRDEITRGFKEIREDIKVLREDHRHLREDLHLERRERIEGDRRDTT